MIPAAAEQNDCQKISAADAVWRREALLLADEMADLKIAADDLRERLLAGQHPPRDAFRRLQQMAGSLRSKADRFQVRANRACRMILLLTEQAKRKTNTEGLNRKGKSALCVLPSPASEAVT